MILTIKFSETNNFFDKEKSLASQLSDINFDGIACLGVHNKASTYMELNKIPLIFSEITVGQTLTFS